MKISYGHMGTLTMIMEMILEELGHEPIVPHRPTRQTLALGAKYSPEFGCIPFKIVLGTYLESLERGADCLVSGGGYGPCRAGLYGDLHGRILNDLGYNPEMIFFFPPLKKPLDFTRKLSRLKGHNSWAYFMRAISKAWAKLGALDELEIAAQQTRPRERNRGDTSRAYQKGLSLLHQAMCREDIEETRLAALAEIKNVAVDPQADPLKVGIIGEIYVQLEPFANFYLEESLGHLGVEARRSIYLTSYTRHDVLSTRGDLNSRSLAMPYLAQKIGGHGQNSIGDVIRYAQLGYDGVVQLAPFSCIPEIVAKSLMPHVGNKYGIPVLTLFIDEQTGPTGIQTRLEAFVDLLEQRRSRAYQGAGAG